MGPSWDFFTNTANRARGASSENSLVPVGEIEALTDVTNEAESVTTWPGIELERRQHLDRTLVRKLDANIDAKPGCKILVRDPGENSNVTDENRHKVRRF